MNVLVDTPVWSLALRRDVGKLSEFERTIRQDLADLTAETRVRIVGPIRQELLSGIRNPAQFRAVRDDLRDFSDEPLSLEDWEAAAESNNACRAAGIAGSAVDFLLCAVAIRRHWEIFTTDKDFLHYARILPVLLRALPRRS
ncbi:MAG: PIN domain-containing protein [Acidobacteriia bacterium]|nr:PIN domain-containing protein [Terriglobia bacterium]